MISQKITLSEALRRINVPKRTADDWLYRSRNKLPLHAAGKSFARIIHRIGGRLFVEESDLNQWRREQRGARHPAVDLGELAVDIDGLIERARTAGCSLTVDALNLARMTLATETREADLTSADRAQKELQHRPAVKVDRGGVSNSCQEAVQNV